MSPRATIRRQDKSSPSPPQQGQKPTRLPETTEARKFLLSPASQFSQIGGMFSVMATQHPGILDPSSAALYTRKRDKLIGQDVTHLHLTVTLGNLQSATSARRTQLLNVVVMVCQEGCALFVIVLSM